ncbi:MAG: type II secretion system protein [Gemmatimonadaceae bacterium]
MTRGQRGRQPDGRRVGFTLIELLVVLAISALATSVVLPAYRSRGQGAADAGLALESALLRSRGAAVERGRAVSYTLETSSGHWIAVAGFDTLLSGDLPLGPSTRIAGEQEGWIVVRFDSRGRARGGPIVLSDTRSRHAVIVAPWTGAARQRALALAP